MLDIERVDHVGIRVSDNLLGPASSQSDGNILMDVADKYAGLTHVSYKVSSIEAARSYLASIDVALSGEFEFRDLQAIFIRDPDLNVIELDGYTGEEPETRRAPEGNEQGGYTDHL